MTEIEQARKTINEADKLIAECFEKRMEAVRHVFHYKKEHGLPILDEKREQEVLLRNGEMIKAPELREYYLQFQKNVMAQSRRFQSQLQNGIRIAYSGVEGAFAHIVAKRLYPNGNHIPCANFKAAYDAVTKGECNLAVLPIENSNAGEVGAVLDMIFQGPLYINGIYNLRVEQNLLGLPGAKKENIKTVLSHPQALSQCGEYIKEQGYKQQEAVNTAVAAQTVANGNDYTTAAIASCETAELYGLEVLERGINRGDINTTRFAVLSPTQCVAENEKSVLMFAVSDEAGSLAKAINIIGKYGINMTVLRSRPLRDHAWKYYFYAETDKNIHSDLGRIMLAELKIHCDLLKVAGTFTERDL